MSTNTIDYAAAFMQLDEELLRRFPGCDRSDPRASDRKLVDDGKLSESELIQLYSRACGVEVVDEEEIGTPELFPEASMAFLNAKCCLPMEWNDTCVKLLVVDPYDAEDLDYNLSCAWKKSIQPVFCRRPFLERLLSKVQSSGEEEAPVEAEDENTLRSMAGEARIVRLVNDIFTQAIELGASDIHVEPGEENVAVRCRVDGVLTEILTAPLR